MTDTEFLGAFEDTTLPRAEWTHRAHLRMAYLYLRGASLDEALPRIRTGIQRYNNAKGNPTGYNECLTVAFARLVASRLTRRASPTFPEFNTDNRDLFDEGMGILFRHYSRPVWKEPEAKENFIEPDLAPF